MAWIVPRESRAFCATIISIVHICRIMVQTCRLLWVSNLCDFDTNEFSNDCDSSGTQVRAGAPVSQYEIVKFAQLFNDELTLDNLERIHLVNLCRFVGIQPFGTDSFLVGLFTMCSQFSNSQDTNVLDRTADTTQYCAVVCALICHESQGCLALEAALRLDWRGRWWEQGNR